MRKTDFTKALTEYFSIYLPTTCGVSPNTTNSYRDTFKQLLLFFQEKKGISANYIELRYLNMELVSEFLDWLETSRHIAVTTRNQRLAAIKAFAHFVQYKFPENIENCVDIINLRPKKYEKALIPFLTEDDLSLLLSQPDASTRQGLRDLTLLALLYDSGARVQELVDLRLKDVRLTHPPNGYSNWKRTKSSSGSPDEGYLQTVGQIYPQLSFRFSVSDDSAILYNKKAGFISLWSHLYSEEVCGKGISGT